VFDPVAQRDEAMAHFHEHGYCVLSALSGAEVAELNTLADRWLHEYAACEECRYLFYPLLDYPEVDRYCTHPRVLPLVAHVLGGLEHVRFQEFNWRGFPGQRAFCSFAEMRGCARFDWDLPRYQFCAW
jgi:hypothetical protein